MDPALVIPRSLRAGVVVVRGLRSPATDAVPRVWLPRRHAQLVVHAMPGGALRAHVSGPSTRATYKRHAAGPFYVQIVLRPEVARAALGVPVHALADRVVELGDVRGRRADEVIERVAAVGDDPQAALAAVADVLAARMQPSPGGQRVARAAESLAREATRIATLADDLGVAERSLRQAFLDHVGLSPKRYLRIARVLRVVADAGRARWTRLAADHGFYDQAHLNAEFRAVMGRSPGAYLAEPRLAHG